MNNFVSIINYSLKYNSKIKSIVTHVIFVDPKFINSDNYQIIDWTLEEESSFIDRLISNDK
ncbi:hypothetical protein [Aliarcobacter cryaerophilus]|uniref:hypothetical protein n=1 Tax=Aliarcobacter cryaerophilus TaxID=28198 RepID=UPI00112F1AE9|nr:hypothetical protein [Aliarcobacter cryaerophilus]QNM91528.1 hypothetical protein HOO33_06425 [Aliarcobacter cryaerophilus]